MFEAAEPLQRSSLGVVAGAAFALLVAAAIALGLAGTLSRQAFTAGRPGGPGGPSGSLPRAAQAPVSGALGAADARYRVTHAGGALVAHNPAQRWQLRFARSGVAIGTGAERLGLSLRAAGYGSALRAVAAVAPSAADNGVRYARGALQEWYANGPLGLEQGFTVTAPCAGGPRDR